MKRSRTFFEHDSTVRTRLIVLLCAALLSIAAGALSWGATLETTMRTMRDAARSHDANGDVVIAGIDDKSIAQIGTWPWPRATYARLSDRLREAGARRMLFDIDFSSPSNPRDDGQFADALAKWRSPAVLAARFSIDPVSGRQIDSAPIALLARHAILANINARYSFNGAITDLPYALRSSGRVNPSLAARLSGMPNAEQLEGKSFPIDFSVRIGSVPVLSIVDVLHGRFDRRIVAGRQVIVAATSSQINDMYFAPGGRLTPGVLFQILGAETLRHGVPVDVSWAMPLGLALILAAWLVRRGGALACLLPLAGLPIALVVPIMLDHFLVFVQIFPALLTLMIVSGGWSALRLRQSLRTRGTTNLVSGLPNLEALRKERPSSAALLITARVQNFAELSAALDRGQEKSLVDQIATRLRLGLPTKLYQGDEGIFAWIEGGDHGDRIGDHLDALHSLFRSPAAVDGSLYDIRVTFGVDAAMERSLANRLGSALVAADEAAAEGARWKRYDGERSKDSAWKLSMLSQLDAAIDDGSLWVAYQPKLDIASGKIVGAEALVRWTHPEKGPISPDEFIKAAEQSNRIERLTNHVLDRAIAAAAAVNVKGRRFGIAVNLSARLLGSDAVFEHIDAVLARHELEPTLLTLEVTETAMLVGDASVSARLARVREKGVQLSIDDYGTGLSTLEYLKTIPATEIKIDKSFVQAMTRDDGDRHIVRSTIELAHSLGRKVVAEGVEEPETLDALAEMRCDIAQGYLISRPVTFRALAERLFGREEQKAA